MSIHKFPRNSWIIGRSSASFDGSYDVFLYYRSMSDPSFRMGQRGMPFINAIKPKSIVFRVTKSRPVVAASFLGSWSIYAQLMLQSGNSWFPRSNARLMPMHACLYFRNLRSLVKSKDEHTKDRAATSNVGGGDSSKLVTLLILRLNLLKISNLVRQATSLGIDCLT